MRHLSITSLLLALVLLLQATFPFMAMLQDNDTARALGQKILICTGATSKWVDWQDLNSATTPNHQPPHQSTHEPSCVLCLPTTSHESADAIIPAFTAPLINIYFTTSIDCTAPHLRTERFAAEHPSRAPPLV